MKTSSSQTIDPVASLSLFLPSGILDYFTLVNHVSQDTCFILYLEEKATIPSEYVVGKDCETIQSEEPEITGVAYSLADFRLVTDRTGSVQ